MLAVLVAEDEQRRQADTGGAEPDQADTCDHAAGRALHAVLEGLGDGVVPVHRDHAQVEDGRGAAEHIERDPQVADHGAERPVAEDLVPQRHRHDEERDAEVAYGQRDEQIVAGSAQLAHQAHGDAHEHVTDHGADDHEQEDQANDHGLAGRVSVRILAQRRGLVGGSPRRHHR